MQPKIVLKWLSIIALVVVFNITIYMGGGTSTALPHLMYLPILLAAYFFGYRGSVTIAVIAGLSLGPYMPLNVNLGLQQSPAIWLIRLSFFLLVSLVSGLLIARMNVLNQRIRETDLRSIYTGLYNTNKLKQDLEQYIEQGKKFSLVTYRITNLGSISKYVDDQTMSQLIRGIGHKMREAFDEHTCYSHGRSEYLVAMEGDSDDHIKKKSVEFYKSFSIPIEVNGYRLQLLVKGGLARYPDHGIQAFDIISHVRAASDQEEGQRTGFFYYNKYIDRRNRLAFEVTNALSHAVKSEAFYLMYQPKYNLHTQSVCGVEALIRWDRKDKMPIGPDIFIGVAEEIGIIDEISLWVARECAWQIGAWQEAGIDVKVSINLTSRELLDPLFREAFDQIFQEAGVLPSQIEIEITERVVVESDGLLKENLQKYSELGYKIAIDDYGTGYNTYFSIGEVDVDVIKIDKYFMDRLQQKEINVLVQSIIDYVHLLDKEVVAEGVETLEQVELLEAMGCDIIQGYYYSEPISADAITAYYDEILHLRYKSQNCL